jgi:hypothetical protein
MYCIVWRHYNSKGITPYVISKYPNEDDWYHQPELKSKVKSVNKLRPDNANKTMGGKDVVELGKFYREQVKNGNVVTNKIIDIDYNTIEDTLVFKNKEASDIYLKKLSELDWTASEHIIIIQKEIKDLKELPSFK